MTYLITKYEWIMIENIKNHFFSVTSIYYRTISKYNK